MTARREFLGALACLPTLGVEAGEKPTYTKTPLLVRVIDSETGQPATEAFWAKGVRTGVPGYWGEVRRADNGERIPRVCLDSGHAAYRSWLTGEAVQIVHFLERDGELFTYCQDCEPGEVHAHPLSARQGVHREHAAMETLWVKVVR